MAQSPNDISANGALLGSVLLFNTFINDTVKGIECTLSTFADDTKLRDAVATPKKQIAIQRDLDELKEQAHENLVWSNKTTCKVLNPDQGKPWYQHRLVAKQI
ncbi:rna-directed dna polymerase from mobile element jockey-like [Willisornis vidua]|uniref:Rna-directed dna polymerase from mobile element jockey-like n=1 Tax=Willisornis vidua TaxID=1566151 RepID=A0ABQ9DUA7_9PASS|nr:rna-directed dna polymerase from mobile element jockey-like [Willisornis vidua]